MAFKKWFASNEGKSLNTLRFYVTAFKQSSTSCQTKSKLKIYLFISVNTVEAVACETDIWFNLEGRDFVEISKT